MTPIIIAVIALALVFDFLNGIHDSSNVVATMISSRAIDDVIDYAYSTVTELEVFDVQATPFMRRIASLLRDAAYELLQAVGRLENHPNVAGDHAQRAKSLENRVEDVYRDALADLFKGADDLEHVVLILKLREIYRHLSNAADRGDEAANVIADIVVKIT